MKKLFLSAFLALSTCATTAPAEIREGNCRHMNDFHKELSEVWQEIPIMSGNLTRNDDVVVMWTNPDTGTWTLLGYKGNNACVVLVGWGAVSVLTKQGEPF